MKQKYNWVTLNESFFDDIEDDIIDNDNGLNNLYEKSFKECNTINEKVEYLMNMLKVEELFNITKIIIYLLKMGIFIII